MTNNFFTFYLLSIMNLPSKKWIKIYSGNGLETAIREQQFKSETQNYKMKKTFILLFNFRLNAIETSVGNAFGASLEFTASTDYCF